MKLYLTLIICSISISFCCAQDSLYQSKTDKQVVDKIKELQEEKTGTIVCYYIYCIGNMLRPYAPDTCISSQIKYLLWLKGNVSLIQKFDECSIYSSVIIPPSFLMLLKNNSKTIEKSKIKPFGITDIVNGKKKRSTMFIDHSCHYVFEIYDGRKLIKKEINDFDLEKKSDYDKHLNRNYYKNQKSILNKLRLLVEQDVAAYEKSLKQKGTHN
ncbi:hypothetical protein KXD93_25315 [Mucilaginibacter sp. BJC16-A38]|uniref:hypothetical protein n=1 Tax=Mucilaginibacter phenanthrenivorans TaxID=1234842 RepID=UPI0021587469|nr:hypothetical protein [Mucilaginibacter phenanthrenivorans]MCR8561002.1 hypothetical protein [Mucilaginibacter phenanthrenivorans]